MAIRLLEPLAEVGAFSFLWARLQPQLTPGSLEGWTLTPERVFYTLGLTIFIGFYGGRIWKDFLSSKSKATSDHEEIRGIRESLDRIEKRQTEDKSLIEKDLLKRRSDVDLRIHDTETEIRRAKERMSISEDWLKKLDRRVARLDERVRPWVGVFEMDGKRSLEQAYGIPPITDVDPITDDGTQG